MLVTSNISFSHSVFYPFGNILPFSSNSKLSSVIFFSLERSKVGRLGKGNLPNLLAMKMCEMNLLIING